MVEVEGNSQRLSRIAEKLPVQDGAMLGRILAVMLVASVWATARADDFPSHTVTIVSPYQAGGTSDIIARMLAQKLSEQWGKT